MMMVTKDQLGKNGRLRFEMHVFWNLTNVVQFRYMGLNYLLSHSKILIWNFTITNRLFRTTTLSVLRLYGRKLVRITYLHSTIIFDLQPVRKAGNA